MYKCPECKTPLNESMFCVKCCSKWIKERPANTKASFSKDYQEIIYSETLEQKKDANYFIDQAKKHMTDRAESYDNEEGERSMLSTVRAFSDITGICMTEEHGWLFMGVLKMVRSQQGKFKSDNYEDGCAYFGLAGEAAAKNRA